MTCNNYGFFRGDDLVDIIEVNRPCNAEDLKIIRAELQVGPLMFPQDNPKFPYFVTILRNQSINLNNENPVYLRIYYLDDSGKTIYRTTCLGSLNLVVNPQVVKDSKK